MLICTLQEGEYLVSLWMNFILNMLQNVYYFSLSNNDIFGHMPLNVKSKKQQCCDE